MKTKTTNAKTGARLKPRHPFVGNIPRLETRFAGPRMHLNELLPAVYVIRSPRERLVAHDMYGQSTDVGGPDDAVDR